MGACTPSVAASARLMSTQKRIVARRPGGTRRQPCATARRRPAAEHELVLRARLESQAPDIDPVVYLTECDPADITSGTFIDAEIVGCREYDFIARPF